MRGRWEYRTIQAFVYLKLVAQFTLQHLPLVVAEIIKHYQEHLLANIQQGEYLRLEYLVRHDWVLLALHPIHIMLFHVFRKTAIGFFLLHLQHLRHLRVGGAQLQLPAHQTLVDVNPLVPCAAVHNLHRQLLELLLVARLHGLRHYLAPVDVLLQRQQYLIGVDRLDQVVGNLLSDGLIHDVLLLTLRHHHHRQLRSQFLDALQGFQSREAGHHLVEQHQVETTLAAFLDGVGSVRYRHHLVAFFLQEEQVGLQQLHLVVSPK